ncbi:phospholipase D family protein [Spirochaeta africana]|nr:phospholipase D family protein [Spirochaeta africana]
MPATHVRPTVISPVAARTGVIAGFAAGIQETLDQGESAVHLIPDNLDALHWRIAMMQGAEQTLDLQYFLWEDDYSGYLLLHELLKAADRGVQVRLLLDDIFLDFSHRTVAAIQQHPNIEVRVYNPVVNRRSVTGTAFRFALNVIQLNRRMHNKLMIADGSLALVGSRNIGDSYFGFDPDYNFRDLDAVTVGPVLQDMMYSFDHYWNTRYAIDATDLYLTSRSRHLGAVRRVAMTRSGQHPDRAAAALPQTPRAWLTERARGFHPGQVTYIYDHPSDRHDRTVLQELPEFLSPIEQQLRIVTPYFLPNDFGMDLIQDKLARNVQVQVIVPSLGSINHTIVHSHYRSFRPRILEMGVDLYEYQHQPGYAGRHHADSGSVEADFISMHMKTLLGDSNRAYIGSLNLNHRSLYTDTENGLLILSDSLGQELELLLADMATPEESWQLALENGRVLWMTDEATLQNPPTRSPLQHIPYFWGALLPIRGFL